MGWGRMLLLGDWGQQMDIQEQNDEIASLRSEVRCMRHAIGQDRTGDADALNLHRLQTEIDELRLFVTVLLRAVQRKNILTPDELKSLIEEIDLEDGQLDGKRAKT